MAAQALTVGMSLWPLLLLLLCQWQLHAICAAPTTNASAIVDTTSNEPTASTITANITPAPATTRDSDDVDDDLIVAITQQQQQLVDEERKRLQIQLNADQLKCSSSSSSSDEGAAKQSSDEESVDGEGDGNENGNVDDLPPPIDMSDLIALIPSAQVNAIVRNYYTNDAEVQRAYAFLASRDFRALQQHVLLVPEINAFIRYLNASGLNIVGFVRAISKRTFSIDASGIDGSDNVEGSDDGSEGTVTTASVKKELTSTPLPMVRLVMGNSETALGNEIERVQQQQQSQQHTTKATLSATTTTTTTDTTTTQTPIVTSDAGEEQQQPQQPNELNGLHGLVDSILDVLPQDQILYTFFDKLEQNRRFSKLVESIGSPAFGKILNDMQNSVALRKLIFTLHNNGIYVTRIVDSLKAYFFLGTF